MIIAAVLAAAAVAAAIIFWNQKKSETRKYRAAAYQMLKNSYLSRAIRREEDTSAGGPKVMLYLKWKDVKKQRYVFNPETGVRIGRTPGVNEICVRDKSVSSSHCRLYLDRGRLAVQDLHSMNATWIQRGFRRIPVREAEYLYSGDRLRVGGIVFKVKVFLFDMSYM